MVSCISSLCCQHARCARIDSAQSLISVATDPGPAPSLGASRRRRALDAAPQHMQGKRGGQRFKTTGGRRAPVPPSVRVASAAVGEVQAPALEHNLALAIPTAVVQVWVRQRAARGRIQ